MNPVRYADKPLPPLPMNPAAFASSASLDDTEGTPFFFDWEMEGRSASARPLVPSQTSEGSDSIRPSPSPATLPRDHARPPKPTQQEGWSAIRWEQRRFLPTNDLAKARERHTLPKVDVPNLIPTIPPDDILSPQPKQSVQKILRLTGNMSLLTTLSADSPTLHNSSQKIKQLTGLDFAPKAPWAEDQIPLVEVEDDISNVSTAETASMHSNESVDADALSVGHPESIFRSSYIESVDEVYTQLTAPKFSTPATSFRDNRSYSEPLVRDALRLSGFIATDSLGRLPTPDKRLAEQRESWFRDHDSDVESHDTSSDEYSDVTELENAADKLCRKTTSPLARNDPTQAFNSSPALEESSTSPPPPRPSRGDTWEGNLPDDMAFAGYKGNSITSPGLLNELAMGRHESATLPPPSPSLFSTEGSRRQEGLSERRLTNGRRLSQLSLPLSSLPPPAPKGGRWAHPRVPDSPDLSADEAEASSARYPLLTKILTSGTASGGHMADNSNYNSNNYSISAYWAQSERGGVPFPTAISISPQKSSENETQQPTSTWSPDTPESGISTFAAASSAIDQRATDDTVITTTPAVNPTSPVTSVATAAGGAGGLGSPTSQDGEVYSPKGLWKRALGHAKSKTGRSSSKTEKKRNK